MTGPTTKISVLNDLKLRAGALGMADTAEDASGFKAQRQDILIKWWLGQRRVTYCMSLDLTEAVHRANFREMVTERSWGLLPPALAVEKTSVRGWERSGVLGERALTGRGKADFGQIRETLKAAIADAGWLFHFEGGRVP